MRALFPILWLALTPLLAAPNTPIEPTAGGGASARSLDGAPSLGALVASMDDAFAAIAKGAEPSEVLLAEVEPATDETRAEFAALLEQAGATGARVEAIELHLAWPERGVRVTVSPANFAIQRLEEGLSVEEIASAMSPYLWREPFAALARATADLGGQLRSPKCTEVPFVTDTAIATVVPGAFQERARTRRDASRIRLESLCPALKGSEADLRVGIGGIHVNLYDAQGAIVGGLRTDITRPIPPYRLAFPQFKAIR